MATKIRVPIALPSPSCSSFLAPQGLLKQAPRAQLRFDAGQFEPRMLQPCASSVGIMRAVVVNPSLCRLPGLGRAQDRLECTGEAPEVCVSSVVPHGCQMAGERPFD